MEQYKSRWGEIPQTAEEHVNMIMGRYRETGDVFKCFDPKVGIFPYPKYLEGLLKDNDWDRLNNLIYQENCVQSLSSLMNTDKQSRYWAFLEMLGALAVGNIKTLELLLPNKIENVTHIFPLYRPATNMLIGLWRKDNSVLDYAVPRAKKFVSGKRPQWERATAAYLLAVYDKNPKEAGVQLDLVCKGVMRADFDDDRDKILCVPAHGLYQLAACLWDEELFRQLPMPNHKIFSKEYAIWRNTQNLQPELFAKYPEPIINDVLISPVPTILSLM